MKYLIVSDIHGSASACKFVLEMFKQHECDKIILLGDILYHGPRNDLPANYNPKEVAKLLNDYKDNILAIKGNCDSDVDQMVLDFPLLAPYLLMEVNKQLICFTHGHLFNSLNLPTKNCILVTGHTHRQACNLYEDHLYLNPGSIALAKDGTYNGFMILENNCFRWYDDSDNERASYLIK